MKLIANGDDFGISKGCNYAIVDCYRNGILSSTSMMPNMDYVEHAAALMKENPGLSVGIHFNLTVGKPLTNCPSLCKEDGTFNKGMLKESSHVKEEEIYQELQAQYDRFVEVTGQKPHHLNSHHGICLIKGAEKIQLELAEKYELPIREMFTMKMGTFKGKVKFGCTKMPNVPFDGSYNTPETLMNAFSEEELQSDEIFEFACHPGYVDYDILQISSLTEGRAYDAYLFTCDEVKNWVKANHIELTDYRSLK
ncbi:MAG: ChbG/HpnK family deacetylase [Holdemanella sp.]|nr:ChbG/HpnK family deacetylase [Holdemanella sp.]